MFSLEGNPPLQQAIDAGLIPRLVEFMKREDEPQLQLESAWALANISSGNSFQTRRVIEEGAVPIFVQLLKSPKLKIVEQVFSFGNNSLTLIKGNMGDRKYFRRQRRMSRYNFGKWRLISHDQSPQKGPRRQGQYHNQARNLGFVKSL